MLDLLLPRRCALCHRAGTALCAACTARLPPAPELAPPPGFDDCAALLAYDGDARRLVAALKFDNHRDAVGVLGAAMARLVRSPVDAVTWAPTSRGRRRARGYDQSELLARPVAAELGRPCIALLERIGSWNQTGHDRATRLEGPRFSATAAPARVLLVDDVRTTGATLCAAADALVEAGARAVVGVTLAATVRDRAATCGGSGRRASGPPGPSPSTATRGG